MKKYEYSIKIVEKGKNYKSLKDRADLYIREEMAVLCSLGIPTYSYTEHTSYLENNYTLEKLGKFGKRDLKDLENKLLGRDIEVKKLSNILSSIKV